MVHAIGMLPFPLIKMTAVRRGKAMIPPNYAYASKPRSLLGVLGLKIDPCKSTVAAGPKLSTLIGLATRFFCEGLLFGVLYIIQQDFVLAYHR